MVTRSQVNRASLLGVAAGITLIIEHWVTYGSWDPTFGHEWLGLLLLIIGMLVNVASRERKEKRE